MRRCSRLDNGSYHNTTDHATIRCYNSHQTYAFEIILHKARATPKSMHRDVPHDKAKSKRTPRTASQRTTESARQGTRSSKSSVRMLPGIKEEPHLSRTKSCSRVPGSIELPMVIAPSRMLVLTHSSHSSSTHPERRRQRHRHSSIKIRVKGLITAAGQGHAINSYYNGADR